MSSGYQLYVFKDSLKVFFFRTECPEDSKIIWINWVVFIPSNWEKMASNQANNFRSL